MKKKDAVDISIEEMDAQQRREELNRKKDELKIKKDRAHPFLIKRMGSGFIDFLFAAAVAIGAFIFSFYLIFPKVGYQKAANYVVKTYQESELFVMGMGGYEELTAHYDETKTPEENYDVPITHYYTTNERAIKDNKYEEYTNAKLDSGFYEIVDGNCVRKESTSYANAKSVLEKEYSKAVAYFDKDPELNKANNLTNLTMSLTLLIVATLGSVIFFMIVPLINKKNQTFGYMIMKLIPVDSKTLAPIQRTKSLFRNFIFVVITFISPFTMNLLFGTLTWSFIPFFVNVAILAFSRYNTGLHDLATSVNVINSNYSNSFEILEALNSQGGNNEHSFGQ